MGFARPSRRGLWIAAEDLDGAATSGKFPIKVHHLKIPGVPRGFDEKKMSWLPRAAGRLAKWLRLMLSTLKGSSAETRAPGLSSMRSISSVMSWPEGGLHRVQSQKSGRNVARSLSVARKISAQTESFGLGELIEGLIGQAMVGIIDRNDAAIGAVAFDLAEAPPPRRREKVTNTRPKLALGRLVRRRTDRPRQAMAISFSTASEADMISQYIARIASDLSGPSLRSTRLRITRSSRSGE